MLFPTRDAEELASRVARLSINEHETSSTEAGEREVAVSIVHMRQDIVLLYSLAVASHRQQVKISRGVWALVAVGLLVLLKLSN